MNENNIIEALNSYDGTQPSLEKTVSVLAAEVGPDWMNKVFEQLGDLPAELKEKLDHVFNYYASLMAWNEAQSYLTQSDPLDKEMMDERLPVLKHWLDFFGQPGQDLYGQLEERYNKEQGSTAPLPNDSSDSDDSDDADDLPEVEGEPVSEADEAEEIEGETPDLKKMMDDLENPASETIVPSDNDVNLEDVKVDENLNQNAAEELKQDTTPSENEPPEAFAVHKAEREISLLDSLQSWLAARCIQLGDIETFAYPYYGMVVDLMRQVVKDIQAVLDMENQDVVAEYCSGGLEQLTRKKEAIESDIQTAVENCESNTTALIEEGMDLNKVKKALGDLDTSTEKEYLGPAPDGFELLDDKPIDEEAVKEQYEQLEEKAQKDVKETDISVVEEKKTSQNEQNSVQRKLSFSLKPKKG